MSSPRLSAILGSSVFRITLVSTIALAAVLIAILWAVSEFQIGRIEALERERIATAAELVATRFQEAGLPGLIDYVAPDGGRIRPPQELVVAKAESEIIAVLRGRDARPVAGFSGLYAGPGWSTAELDYDIVDGPVLAYRFDVNDLHQITLALFVPERIGEIRGFAVTGSWALAVVSLPLGLLLGVMLGWLFAKRLNALASTVEGVAAGAVDLRAGLSGSGDEFDRVSTSLNKMLDRIKALTRNIEYVSIGVAHDLRTPLGNIGGRLQLMARDIESREALERHIAAAAQHIETLLRTFDALLRLGEVEAGSRRARFEPVQLSELMTELGGSFVPVFADADKTLELNIAPEITVQGDPALLVQMASNMLENSVEHGRDGARAWLSLVIEDGAPVLEIGDDGPGIPEPHRARVFERFYRVETSRSTPGNGLGLSLTKAIADLHEARVALDPNAQGTVLRVRFQMKG